MGKSKRARIIKTLVTFAGAATMCDACGGQLTGCIYDSIKNGEPITVGQGSQIITTHLPVMAQSAVTFGSL